MYYEETLQNHNDGYYGNSGHWRGTDLVVRTHDGMAVDYFNAGVRRNIGLYNVRIMGDSGRDIGKAGRAAVQAVRAGTGARRVNAFRRIRQCTERSGSFDADDMGQSELQIGPDRNMEMSDLRKRK